MKILILISFLLGSLMILPVAFADGESDKVIKKEEQSKKPKKRERRKKIEMCGDCGKPETECDCEGHGHNHDHGDDHKDKD